MNNPFTSDFFSSTWFAVFKPGRKVFEFPTFRSLRFYKIKYLPIFLVSGGHTTKGITYALQKGTKAFLNKVFIIYDFPNYFTPQVLPERLGIQVAKQHIGYYTNLKTYENFEAYFKANFKGKTRNRIRSFKTKLEKFFDIEYRVVQKISESEYDLIFSQFYQLLTKRFDEKQDFNVNLNEKEWEFIKAVSFKLINDGDAILLLILDNKKPVGISLNYLMNNVLILGHTVFDTDYARFNIGKVQLLKTFEWCFANNIDKYDFSKGYFHYKSQWGDTPYFFEYHIYYDRFSPFSYAIAHSIGALYRFKNFLRNQGVNHYINKIKYAVKGKQKQYKMHYNIKNITSQQFEGQMHKLRLLDKSKSEIAKKISIECAYKYQIPDNLIRVFAVDTATHQFYVEGMERYHYVTTSFH